MLRGLACFRGPPLPSSDAHGESVVLKLQLDARCAQLRYTESQNRDKDAALASLEQELQQQRRDAARWRSAAAEAQLQLAAAEAMLARLLCSLAFARALLRGEHAPRGAAAAAVAASLPCCCSSQSGQPGQQQPSAAVVPGQQLGAPEREELQAVVAAAHAALRAALDKAAFYVGERQAWLDRLEEQQQQQQQASEELEDGRLLPAVARASLWCTAQGTGVSLALLGDGASGDRTRLLTGGEEGWVLQSYMPAGRSCGADEPPAQAWKSEGGHSSSPAKRQQSWEGSPGQEKQQQPPPCRPGPGRKELLASRLAACHHRQQLLGQQCWQAVPCQGNTEGAERSCKGSVESACGESAAQVSITAAAAGPSLAAPQQEPIIWHLNTDFQQDANFSPTAGTAAVSSSSTLITGGADRQPGWEPVGSGSEVAEASFGSGAEESQLGGSCSTVEQPPAGEPTAGGLAAAAAAGGDSLPVAELAGWQQQWDWAASSELVRLRGQVQELLQENQQLVALAEEQLLHVQQAQRAEAQAQQAQRAAQQQLDLMAAQVLAQEEALGEARRLLGLCSSASEAPLPPCWTACSQLDLSGAALQLSCPVAPEPYQPCHSEQQVGMAE